MEVYADRLEHFVKKELTAVQESVAKMADKLMGMEAEVLAMKQKVESIEDSTKTQQGHIMGLALKMLDMENRSRRNNIRLRGIPESVGGDALWNTVTAILNSYLGRPAQDSLELDRVHRAPGSRGGSPGRPRDVICRVHFFQVKDSIMRAAWDKGSFSLEGAQVILLQDLARNTLAMRRHLKPLLEVARQQGATYRWGFPFQLFLRLNGRFFVLKSPSQLTEAFAFLGAPPVEIADWLKEALVFP